MTVIPLAAISRHRRMIACMQVILQSDGPTLASQVNAASLISHTLVSSRLVSPRLLFARLVLLPLSLGGDTALTHSLDQLIAV